MSKSSAHRSSPPRRHAPYRRWPAADKAALLAAFPRSGQSAVAFCRAAGVPLATFAVWQRAARRPATRPATRPVFAQVALAVADDESAASRAAPLGRGRGIRAVVRHGTGATIALDGLEASTVRDLVAMLLAVDVDVDGGVARAAPR